MVVNSHQVSVGIGTDNPDGILHAQKANAGADTAIMIENSGQSGTSTASLVFTGNGGAGQEKARIKSAVYGDGFMDFHTNDDSFAMRIDSSGNVGVNTNSPTEKLDIDGDSIRLRQAPKHLLQLQQQEHKGK